MRQSVGWVTALLLGLGLLTAPAAAQSGSPGGPDRPRPVVFVHGGSGSASQFETHAQRFASNGFPADRVFAFEYDTGDFDLGSTHDQLDAFLDEVRAETGASHVDVAAHSLGTSVMTTYLDDFTGGADKVAHYANIDGRAPAELPGGVPTIGIWGEWNSGGEYARQPGLTLIGPDPAANFHFPEMSHTEVATSPEAFGLMYEFFTGDVPATTRVLPEPPGRVKVSGRATLFPQNAGFDGATVEVWRIHATTGHRVGARPAATFAIDETGDFGPIRVPGRQHLEFALVRPDGSVHHFYFEPFVRSNHFLRLNSSIAGSGIDGYLPKSSDHTLLTAVRQREFWGDQGQESDVLEIDGVDLLTPQISPRLSVNAAAYAFDAGSDQRSDLAAGVVPPFGVFTFLTAGDLHIPAATPATGSVRVALTHRGGRTSVINVPNWASDAHRVTVQFRDDLR